MERTVVGIDLGTTFSLVACIEGGRPRLIPNVLGERLTPSVVGLDDRGEIIVGASAVARRVTHPQLTASLFKRSMGTKDEYTLGSRKFRPEELSAFILRSLREDAERHLGRSIDEAIVTVPAYFGELQRAATKDACAIAGLHVERIINEPTAAALAFGLEHQERELRAIVLDLGGGTFDVTVLEILEGVVEIQATAGDTRLGGEDFTEALVEDLRARLIAAHPGAEGGLLPETRARLRRAAETAKRTLSANDSASISLTGLEGRRCGPFELAVELERTDVERLWGTLLGRIGPSIWRALSDAKVSPSAIDEVLLVGGATRLPCVRALAREIFGPREFHEIQPDEAVVQGAAIQASLKAGDRAVGDLVVTDVAPFTLGIEVSKKVGSRYIGGNFLPVIERGTVLPASRAQTIEPVEPGQRFIQLEIYQGEHFEAAKNQKLGTFRVPDLPKGDGSPSVDVRFTYDLNGLLEIDVEVLSTGRKHSFVVEKSGKNLTKQEIEAARARMRTLKFHPREALPNVTAMARAEALYVELRGEGREILSEPLAFFRAALESQDPEKIAAARNLLIETTDQLSRARFSPGFR